jgi:hypothetical protein
MSNLHSHALMEFKAAGWIDENGKFNDEIQEDICNHVLKLLEVFADEGHSGSSAPYAIDLFNKLANFKPLTPLTGEDSEWVDVSEYSGTTMYQNKRCSSVFKQGKNSEAYNIDGKVFWSWYRDSDGIAFKSYYTCYESRVLVAFPYTVPDKPIYEYRWSDAEPKSPPQNEEGFLEC